MKARTSDIFYISLYHAPPKINHLLFKGLFPFLKPCPSPKFQVKCHLLLETLPDCPLDFILTSLRVLPSFALSYVLEDFPLPLADEFPEGSFLVFPITTVCTHTAQNRRLASVILTYILPNP